MVAPIMDKLYTAAKIVFLLNRIFWVSSYRFSHVMCKCSREQCCAFSYPKSEVALQIASANKQTLKNRNLKYIIIMCSVL